MPGGTAKPLPLPPLWADADPSIAARDPRLLELLAYWNAKRAGRPMPSRADIRPEEIRRLLPNLILIDVEPSPLRLRYRLIGTEITRTMQRDSTGKYYDEIYEPALLEEIHGTFRRLFAGRRPLRTFGQAFYPDKNFYSYETLNLPLSEDGETVNMVLGLLVFHLGTPPA